MDTLSSAGSTCESPSTYCGISRCKRSSLNVTDVSLELEGYDPRGLLIPSNPGLRSLSVHDVQDADDWLEELLSIDDDKPRFPNLRHLSLHSTTLLSFPSLPLSQLTHLDLSINLLNAIPSSISGLHSLQSLNLSNNLITSLRNAPSVLGNLRTLNRSKNRIDCLIGLERVLKLERIDVRSTELVEYAEVGRLAVLPHVREVWCGNNAFDRPGMGDEWRIELGVAFAAEGRGEVVIDDQPWSWTESRRIETALAARGRTSHSHIPAQQPESHAESSRHALISSETSPQTSIRPTSNLPSPASSAVPHKKRRPRRVINLDETDPPDRGDLPVGGSLRLPRSSEVIEEEPGASSVRVQRKDRRGRVSTSLYEPSSSGEVT